MPFVLRFQYSERMRMLPAGVVGWFWLLVDINTARAHSAGQSASPHCQQVAVSLNCQSLLDVEQNCHTVAHIPPALRDYVRDVFDQYLLRQTSWL